MVIADARNFHNVDDFCNRNSYFFFTIEDYSDFDSSVLLADSDVENICAVIDIFSEIPESKWNQENLASEMHELCDRLATKLKIDNFNDVKTAPLRDCNRLIQRCLRAAIAKGRHGPGIIQTMDLIGRHTCRKRLLHFKSSVRSDFA